MRDALICGAVRTAVGGLGGALRPITAEEMAGRVISDIMARFLLDGPTSTT